MKKILLALVFTLLLTTAAFAVNTTAQPDTATTSAFLSPQRTQTYDQRFTDVAATATFYDNVVALYEYGLTTGKTDTTFDLTSAMSVGEIVIFTARLHSLFTLGDSEAGITPFHQAEQSVYDPYYLYLSAQGLDLSAFANQTIAVTRAQTAHLLAFIVNLGGADLFAPINQDVLTQGYATKTFLPDVDDYTPYFYDILTLYRTGITVGYDAVGSFDPQATLSRGAASAMLTRIIDPQLRLPLSWDLDSAGKNALTMGDLVTPGPMVSAPTTLSELQSSLRWMMHNNENSLTFQFPGLTQDQAYYWMGEALDYIRTHIEQMYNQVHIAYNSLGKMEMRFDSYSNANMEPYRQETLHAALEVQAQLYEQGALRADMSDTQKAEVLFAWVAEKVTYDDNAPDASWSHLAYSTFFTDKAVCDSYTGAFNLLLKLEGINCYSLANDNHMWSVVNLDGTWVHCDATWADTHDVMDWFYFAMTEEESYAQHPWTIAA